MKLYLVLQIAVLTFFAQVSSCSSQDKNPMEKWKGLDDENDLVFLYKKTTTSEERETFNNSVLYKPFVGGHGRAHQDGIQDLMLGKIIFGYDGGIINFAMYATPEQRKKIREAIASSPLILRVYENVVPNKINDVPTEKNEEARRAPPTNVTKTTINDKRDR